MDRDNPQPDKDDEARGRKAGKSVVADFMDRLMGVFGYSGMTPTMKAALDAGSGSPSAPAGAGPVGRFQPTGIAMLLKPVADCVTLASPSPALVEALGYLWSNRQLSRTLLAGSGGKLRKLVQQNLRSTALPTGISAARIATDIATAQLAALNAWLATGSPAGPEEMAAALHAQTRMMKARLIG